MKAALKSSFKRLQRETVEEEGNNVAASTFRKYSTSTQTGSCAFRFENGNGILTMCTTSILVLSNPGSTNLDHNELSIRFKRSCVVLVVV